MEIQTIEILEHIGWFLNGATLVFIIILAINDLKRNKPVG